MVSRGHRRRPLPDRRHLVADRDRRDHDRAAARRDPDQARARRRCPFSASAPSGRHAGRTGAAGPGRLSGDPPTLAVDAADDLRRPGALRADSIGARSRAPTSPATAPAATRTATSGSWAAIDDVLNVAGHASARWRSRARWCVHPTVAEAAVVGTPDELKGEAVRRVRDAQGAPAWPREAAMRNCASTSCKEIGAIARPDEIRFTDALPKTRTGKIMRRLLRDIARARDARRHHHARGFHGAGQTARGRGVAARVHGSPLRLTLGLLRIGAFRRIASPLATMPAQNKRDLFTKVNKSQIKTGRTRLLKPYAPRLPFHSPPAWRLAAESA